MAQSICLDILTVAPDHEAARICLVLAHADRIAHGAADVEAQARAEIARLPGEYERSYYSGILSERRAYAALHGGGGSKEAAYYNLVRAMNLYQRAQTLSPAGNDDATLRYNTCVRLIREHRLEPADALHEYPLE
ncbi:MAG: hypothetical protein HYV07_26030 [Deltaproteobacteria bacterium]|nr:hypothetical protein [Deltaproteobacteria bacterium]